ncbi:MAG: CPBP family intramembrane glutamic endopeptidase [Halolamina sp.]
MSARDDDRRVPPSRPVALVVASTLAVGGLLVSSITGLLGLLLGALAGSGADPDAAVPVLVGVLLVAAEAGFVVIGYAFRQSDDGASIPIDWLPSGGPVARDAVLVGAATLGLVAVNRAAFWLGSLVDIDPVTAVGAPEELSVAMLAFMILAMLVAVGPAEEYLFRGVIQGYLRASFSAQGAIGLSAVLFAVVHLPNLVAAPESGVVSIPVWLVIGVVLGWLYEHTASLLVPVAVHGIYNVVVISLLFAEQGVV